MEDQYKKEKEKLKQMKDAVRSNRVAIILHNNPDPDCLAAASALQYLLKKHFRKEAALFYRGLIGRAENRSMVNQLKIEAFPYSEIDFRRYKTIAMVDTQPSAGNNPLPSNIIPDIVIDHHRPIRKKTRQVQFQDVRPEAGSSSTIMTRYLRAAEIVIPKNLTTALLYGIKTDTFDLEREAGPDDVSAYRFLLDKVDRNALTRIEHPIHNRSYYAQLHKALENAEIYDDACVTTLEKVAYPEITAELAEWFYFMWGIHWSLSIGVENNEKIYLSLRTRDKKKRASTVINKIAGPHGMAGGHERSAGGMIQLEKPCAESVKCEIACIKKRFLKALKKPEDSKPVKLIQNGAQKQ